MKFQIEPFFVEDKREHTLIANEDNSYTAYFVSGKVVCEDKEVDLTTLNKAVLYVTLYDDGGGDINNALEKGTYKIGYDELVIKGLDDSSISQIFLGLLFGDATTQQAIVANLASSWGIVLL